MKAKNLKIFSMPGVIIIISAVLLILLIFSLQACKKDGKENKENLCPVVTASAVPQAVKDSFAVRYPATNVTTWFNKDGVAYCAYFISAANVEKLVQFATNGSFIKEEIETHQDVEQADSLIVGGKVVGVSCECETHHKEGD